MSAQHTPGRDCGSCLGTGIGWNGPDSLCPSCGGTGTIRPESRWRDEDRWAFNHFEPEPGECDDTAIAQATGSAA